MKIEVSVIIPAYNEEKYIARCLESLQKQTYPSFEIIIVDDGSTDRTQEIVKGFAVRFLKQSHKGSGSARNLGARNAQGNILVFIDADIECEPHLLERLTQPILKGEAKGTFWKEELVANWDNLWSKCFNLHFNNSFSSKRTLNVPAESNIYRAVLKDEFLKAGGFKENRGITDDQIYALPFRAKVVEGAICYHHNPSSLKEVFISATWIGKGMVVVKSKRVIIKSFLKNIFPLSFLLALKKTIKFRLPHYPIFRIIYGLGICYGIIYAIIFKKYAK